MCSLVSFALYAEPHIYDSHGRLLVRVEKVTVVSARCRFACGGRFTLNQGDLRVISHQTHSPSRLTSLN